MKRFSLTLLALIVSNGAACTSTARNVPAPPSNPREAQGMPERVTLPSLAGFGELSDFALGDIGQAFSPGSAGITREAFQRLLASARVVSKDEDLSAWSFAPFYQGSFTASGARYVFMLYLGGLGRLDTTRSQYGYFRYVR